MAVLARRRTLHACYDQNIAIDGMYFDRTRQAVMNVQNFHNHHGGAGLAVDGIYGPRTGAHTEFVNTQGRCRPKT